MKCANNFYNRLPKGNAAKFALLIMVCSLFGLSACATKPSGRYHIEQDTAPDYDYGTIQYQTVEPTFEPYNIWTSRPYKVLGNYYTPLITGKGHEEEGQASWYGQKFHGHKTANGETFDMFALSAAHKTLPLPSFVKVTNLANNKSITVRVNDRGPFHGDRIIDLSYGAAKKLGYHKSGVADVKIEVIHVSEMGDITIGRQPTQYATDQAEMLANKESHSDTPIEAIDSSTADESHNSQQDGLFVQVMAMQNGEKAKNLASGLASLLQVPISLPKVENVFKLHLGPLANEQKAQSLIKELDKLGFDQAFTVEISPQ